MSRRWGALAVVLVALAVAGWRAPAVLDQLPGPWLVRLQSHPLTAGVVAWARPVPATLPTRPPPDAMPPPPVPSPPPTAVPTPTPLPTTSTTPTAAAALAATLPAVPTATALPPTATPLPARHVLADVAVVAQSFSNCGPANLAIVLDYWDSAESQSTIAAVIRPNQEDRNVSPWELRDFVNRHTDLRAVAHAGGDTALLRRLLAAGFPVIIQRGYDVAELGWFGHYLTLYGYDDADAVFLSRDTSAGPFDGAPRRDAYAAVDAMWHQFNRNFVVVFAPPDGDRVSALLGPTYADDAAMWQHAADQAAAAVAADPADPFAWHNLGVSRTRLALPTGDAAQLAAAGAAFDQARAIGIPSRLLFYEQTLLENYLAAGRLDDLLWLTTIMTTSVPAGRFVEELDYYHGVALHAAGDVAEARAAFERALRVNPAYEPARAALAALP